MAPTSITPGPAAYAPGTQASYEQCGLGGSHANWIRPDEPGLVSLSAGAFDPHGGLLLAGVRRLLPGHLRSVTGGCYPVASTRSNNFTKANAG